MIETKPTEQPESNPKPQTPKALTSFFADPARIFLGFGLVFGFLFLVILPPFQVPDENRHFYRAYQISDGGIIAQKQDGVSGGFLPKSLAVTFDTISKDVPHNPENKIDPADIRQMFSLPLNRNDREFVDFAGSAVYSPVAYLPQIVGISLGKLFDFSPLVLMYLGRICNLLTSVYLIYLAIKITPVFKWVFLMTAVTPIALQQTASLSADSLTNSVAFLFVAWVLWLAFDETKKLEQKDIIVLALLSLGLTLCKQAYFPLILLYFVIPRRKVGSIKKYLAIGGGLLVGSLITVMLWTIAALGVFGLKADGATVSPGERLRGILTDPLNFSQIVFNEYSRRTPVYLTEFVGNLGWLDTRLPLLLQIVYVFTIVFVAVANSTANIQIGWADKSKILGVVLLGMLAVTTLAYISWAPLNQEVSLQLQGRYFIPFAPAFLLIFYNRRYKLKLNSPRFGLALCYFLIFCLGLSLWIMFNRYYVAVPT